METTGEKFQASPELIKELEEMNNIKSVKRGRPPKKKAAKKKVCKVKKSEDRLVHTADNLVGAALVKEGKGHPVPSEYSSELFKKLLKEGIDPLAQLAEYIKNPDLYDIEHSKVLDKLVEITKFEHGTKKSIEKKETKEWTINVQRRDFDSNDKGEVIEV